MSINFNPTLQLISINQCLICNIHSQTFSNFNEIIMSHQIKLSSYHQGFIIKTNFLSSLKRYLLQKRQKNVHLLSICPVSIKFHKQALNNHRRLSQKIYQQRYTNLLKILQCFYLNHGVNLFEHQIREVQQFCLYSKKYIIGDQSGMGKTLTAASIINAIITMQKKTFESQIILVIVPVFMLTHWFEWLKIFNLLIVIDEKQYQQVNKKKSQTLIQKVFLLSYESLQRMNQEQHKKLIKKTKLVVLDQITLYLHKQNEQNISINSQNFYLCLMNIAHQIQNVLILDSQAKNYLKQILPFILQQIKTKQLNFRYFNHQDSPQTYEIQFWKAITNGKLFARNIKNKWIDSIKIVYLNEKLYKKQKFAQLSYQNQSKQFSQCETLLSRQNNLDCQQKQLESIYDYYCLIKALSSIDYIKYRVKKVEIELISIIYANQITKKKIQDQMLNDKLESNIKLRYLKIDQLSEIQIRPNQTFLFVQFFLPKMKHIIQHNLTHQFMMSNRQIFKLQTNPFHKQINFKTQFSNNFNFPIFQKQNHIKNIQNISTMAQFQKKLLSIQECRPNKKNCKQQQKQCEVNSTNSSVRGQIDSCSNSKSNQTNKKKQTKKIKQKIVCINLESDGQEEEILEIQLGANKKKRKKEKLQIKKKIRIVYFDAEVKEDAIRILSQSEEQNER